MSGKKDIFCAVIFVIYCLINFLTIIFNLSTKRHMSVEAYLENKQNIIKQFAVSATDTGSSSVQIALLTQRIVYLTEHMKANHKDMSARYALLVLVAKRNKFMKYLKKKNEGEYNRVVEMLGLRRK